MCETITLATNRSAIAIYMQTGHVGGRSTTYVRLVFPHTKSSTLNSRRMLSKIRGKYGENTILGYMVEFTSPPMEEAA